MNMEICTLIRVLNKFNICKKLKQNSKIVLAYVLLRNTPNSKSLERAWSRGIVDRAKEYSSVLSTMPRLRARSRLSELGVFGVIWPVSVHLGVNSHI